MNCRLPIADCRLNCVVALAAAFASLVMDPLQAAEPAKPAQFQEVLSLIRSNLPGAKADELDRAALQGVLERHRGRVLLVNASTDDSTAGAITRTDIFEESIASVRIARVGTGSADQLRAALDGISAMKKPKGLVIDLRAAKGSDYAAAVAVADLFLDNEKPQLEIGGKTLRSTAKPAAITQPIAILVNRETSGAAEALAALLRQNRTGLLIGSATAGEAFIFKEFALSTGQRFRIATDSVRLANGPALTGDGVRPDVPVLVSLEEERRFMEDAFRESRPPAAAPGPLASATPPRKRLNEAELVRRQKEGEDGSETSPAARAAALEAAKPLVRDPALARALDLLKGLAVVGRSRPL